MFSMSKTINTLIRTSHYSGYECLLKTFNLIQQLQTHIPYVSPQAMYVM